MTTHGIVLIRPPTLTSCPISGDEAVYISSTAILGAIAQAHRVLEGPHQSHEAVQADTSYARASHVES